MEPMGRAGQRRAILGQLCALLAGGQMSSARLGSREGALSAGGRGRRCFGCLADVYAGGEESLGSEGFGFRAGLRDSRPTQKLVVHAVRSIISQLPRAIA